LKVLELIKKQFPRTEVIIMDLIPAHSEVAAFVKVGVSGFILKDVTLDKLLHAIRTVVKGARILPPTMADSLFSKIVESAIQGGTVARVIAAVKLTKREQHVVNLLAKGQSITEVAITLKVAVFTVKSHVRNILDKLALHTRLELASFANLGKLT
jgi:DNA-binding NarL/FixJ family response regulator